MQTRRFCPLIEGPTSSLSGSDLTFLGFGLVLRFSAVEFSWRSNAHSLLKPGMIFFFLLTRSGTHSLTHTHTPFSPFQVHPFTSTPLMLIHAPSTFLPSWVTFQNQGALYIWKTNFFYWINSSKLPRSSLTTTAEAEGRIHELLREHERPVSLTFCLSMDISLRAIILIYSNPKSPAVSWC